jgi:hypothetical protein
LASQNSAAAASRPKSRLSGEYTRTGGQPFAPQTCQQLQNNSVMRTTPHQSPLVSESRRPLSPEQSGSWGQERPSLHRTWHRPVEISEILSWDVQRCTEECHALRHPTSRSCPQCCSRFLRKIDRLNPGSGRADTNAYLTTHTHLRDTGDLGVLTAGFAGPFTTIAWTTLARQKQLPVTHSSARQKDNAEASTLTIAL